MALAQSLQLKVVAEGVETAEQQAFLTSLGCNTLQGYLLGKPIPPDRVEELANFVGEEKIDAGAELNVTGEPLTPQVAPARRRGGQDKWSAWPVIGRRAW